MTGARLLLVAYYRVSTARQGQSGLGLEGQRAAIADHVAGTGAVLLESFTEIESGRRPDRPQLAAAVGTAKLRGAAVVVAKLDRLSRDARFLLDLVDRGAPVRFLDLPDLPTDTSAGRLILTVMAGLAEFESRRISERLRAAFAARLARGLPHPGTGRRPTNAFTSADTGRWRERSTATRRAKYLAWARDFRAAASRVRAELGGASIERLAAELNARGFTTRTGRAWQWPNLSRALTPRPWEAKPAG